MFMRKDEPYKVASVRIGRGPGMSVAVYGFNKDDGLGVPLVGMGGALEYLEHLTIEQADHLSDALKLAACVARGDIVRPETPLKLGTKGSIGGKDDKPVAT